MRLFFIHLSILVMIFINPSAKASMLIGEWTNYSLFNQTPLEAKLGTFTNGDNPDALAVILWNDGDSNRIDALRIPPPYTGSGFTSTPLEDTNVLFALGDICTMGNTVLVPYVKDFNVEVARYDGNNWSTSTIPGTMTNNFDNADCVATVDGLFIGTHDLTDGETEIFRTVNSGSSYTFYGRYSSKGPFDGAVREPFASSFNDRHIMGLNQQSNGQINITQFDTQNDIPVFNHTTIENLTPPPGSFTFVKESNAAFNGRGITFTYNADGNARVVDIQQANPFSVSERNLGPVDNNGSQFSFQGSGLLPVQDLDGNPLDNMILWDNLFITEPFNPSSLALVDIDYPLSGVGGPVDACRLDLIGEYTNESTVLVVGARVGMPGTDLFHGDLEVDAIFADGFESGDTSSWNMNCE